ncbi:group II truncated hemoglobin [Actinomadura miaoliensis]|uniref:Globin n=1 Tax=Actinomadura miaoliensis TaxID=430685 RepID=A0ABP7WS66_9ACTN
MTTLYEHAGGHGGLHRFITIFYNNLLSDPLLQPLFGVGRPTHIEHLTAFTAETFGGPDMFSREMGGFPSLIDAHRHLKITAEQRQRFIDLFMAAADGAGLPDDAPFRQALREHVEFGAEVAMRNSHAETDDQLHPLREVPKWDWPSPTP